MIVPEPITKETGISSLLWKSWCSPLPFPPLVAHLVLQLINPCCLASNC